MNRGLRIGLFGVLMLAVLVMAGIVASHVPRESVATSSNAETTSSSYPEGTARPAATSAMTMSPVAQVPAVSPRPPSSAGPVAVHVLPARTTAPSAAPSAQNLTASPPQLATIKPQPQPSIVLAQNGLPEGVPYAGEHDPIRIASVTLSADEVKGGDIASARVVTTSNAAALTARIGTYQVNVPRVAPGIFSIAITVPHLPVRDQVVDIIVTAIRSDGATAQTTVPLKVSF